MSWQDYVDNNLVGTGKISRACIIGLKGGVWATTAGFTLTPAEVTEIIKSLNALGNDTLLQGVQASGIRAAGAKYFFLQATARSIYCKKGADGIILTKTNQAVLLGEYKAPVQAGEATVIVEGLADYLLGVGY